MSLWGPAEIENKDLQELGIGFVVTGGQLERFAETEDHGLAIVRAKSGMRISHYAGFGWTRSRDFSSADDWKDYLSSFSKRMETPVRIKISKVD
jgi:hypothetical protein